MHSNCAECIAELFCTCSGIFVPLHDIRQLWHGAAGYVGTELALGVHADCTRPLRCCGCQATQRLRSSTSAGNTWRSRLRVKQACLTALWTSQMRLCSISLWSTAGELAYSGLAACESGAL